MRGEFGTSCNIVLRSSKAHGRGYIYDNFYCKDNGEPENVGFDLQEIMRYSSKSIFNSLYKRETYVRGTTKIKYNLHDFYSTEVHIDRDICYLYLFDFDTDKLYCYDVDISNMYSVGISREEVVNLERFDSNTGLRKTLVFEKSLNEQ